MIAATIIAIATIIFPIKYGYSVILITSIYKYRFSQFSKLEVIFFLMAMLLNFPIMQ